MYSFAVVLWSMLTGLAPWDGHSHLAIAYAMTVHKVGRVKKMEKQDKP